MYRIKDCQHKYELPKHSQRFPSERSEKTHFIKKLYILYHLVKQTSIGVKINLSYFEGNVTPSSILKS